MSPTAARPVWQSFVSLFGSLQHLTDTRYWHFMCYNIWGHQKKFLLSPIPPISSFFLLGFHLYLPGILFYYSLCLYCKIFRFLLGCFLTGTSSVPHSPVLSFQGESKGQGWEVLERVKVMVRKWEWRKVRPDGRLERGVVPVDHAVDVCDFVGRPEIRNCDASDFSPS